MLIKTTAAILLICNWKWDAFLNDNDNECSSLGVHSLEFVNFVRTIGLEFIWYQVFPMDGKVIAFASC